MTKSRGILGYRRRYWSAVEIAKLRELYPDTKTEKIARTLNRNLSGIYRIAAKLGLQKSAAFLASSESGRLTKLTKSGEATRFQKGITPWNKGLHYMPSGRCRETQFRKGQFPFNRDPEFYVIGALRVNTDGYLDMRTSFEHGALGWRALHRILWEDAHGKIPRTHCLVFKDGDRLNVELSNLEMISRKQNMMRNTVHKLPKALVSAKQLLGQLKRRIHEKQDRRSA